VCSYESCPCLFLKDLNRNSITRMLNFTMKIWPQVNFFYVLLIVKLYHSLNQHILSGMVKYNSMLLTVFNFSQ